MALTFDQQQELETLLEEFKQKNRLYGTVQITMNDGITLFKSTRGVDGDTYEDVAYQRGYLAAVNDYNTKLSSTYQDEYYRSLEDKYDKGYDEGCVDGYDEGYAEGYETGYAIAREEGE